MARVYRASRRDVAQPVNVAKRRTTFGAYLWAILKLTRNVRADYDLMMHSDDKLSEWKRVGE